MTGNFFDFVPVDATHALRSDGMHEISESEFHSIWGAQVAADGDLLRFEDTRRRSPNHVRTVVESGDDREATGMRCRACTWSKRWVT